MIDKIDSKYWTIERVRKDGAVRLAEDYAKKRIALKINEIIDAVNRLENHDTSVN